MTKTINLGGLTSVKIKQSAYDMARFCWIRNLSEADVFASCVNAECTENADEVRRISSGEFGMLDTESYEKLYLNGSGAVEIVTSALLVCPFDRGGKGGGSYELPIATTEILGGVMPDGTTINVDENGVISGLTAGAKLLVSGTGKLFTYTGSYEVFFVYVGAVSYTDSNNRPHKYTIDKRGFILKHNSSTDYIDLYDDSGSNGVTVRVMDNNTISVSPSATVCVYGV